MRREVGAAASEGEKSARKKKDELEVAVKNEAHKLQQISDALAALQALQLSGERACRKLCAKEGRGWTPRCGC